MRTAGWLRFGKILLAAAPFAPVAPVACDRTLLVGEQGGVAGALNAPEACRPATCGTQILACGDCVDNDGDGLADAKDPDCLGACHDSETGFLDGKTMMANRCAQDCYFDGDLGTGNDGCSWPLECDPLRDAINAQGKCSYDAAFVLKVGPESFTCGELQASQAASCTSSCPKITPNGCDCFGCCQVPLLDHAVWLGSVDAAGNPTCSAEFLSDPTRCRPCTPVASCRNPCEGCEVCFGAMAPAKGCDAARPRCREGQSLCGQPGEGACAKNFYCLGGCCVDTSASSLGR